MADQNEVEDFLEHHGVKGMHWGVRHRRDETSSSPNVKTLESGLNNLTKKDKAVLDAAGMSPLQAESLKAKYGPGSNDIDAHERHLTPTQKKLIVAGAIGVGIIALGAYGVHVEKQGTLNSLIAGGFEKEAASALLKEKPADAKILGGLLSNGMKKPAAEYLLTSDVKKLSHSLGMSAEEAAKLSHQDLNFPSGHVFKRVSMQAEREINANGFFASHSDVDTERYKAILPTYWKLWVPENPPSAGFVNHYQASIPLKVASEGTMYNTMKDSLDDIISTRAHGSVTLRKYLKLNTATLIATDDELVRKGFYNLVANFADPKDPVVKHLSGKLASAGYHGIIDSNDAGSLAEEPIKFLTGGPFKIVAHEILSTDGISSAQNTLLALAHAILSAISGGEMADQNEVDEFLEHHGVKGMHWGVRRSHPKIATSARSMRPTTEQIHDARARTASRAELQRQQFIKLNLATTEQGKKAAVQAIAKLGEEGAADAKLAAVKTTGEKVATGLLVGAAGLVVLGSIVK